MDWKKKAEKELFETGETTVFDGVLLRVEKKLDSSLRKACSCR